MNLPCHSERSEESRLQCGDKRPQPWNDRFARNHARTAPTDIGKVWSGKRRERSGILRCAQNDTKTNDAKMSGDAMKSETKIGGYDASSDFCVIPSEAEGPRIFLDACRRTPNYGATTMTAGVPE
jgi:hypothetical protein